MIALKNQIPVQNADYLEVSQFKTDERWLLETDEIRQKLQKLEAACLKQSPTSLIGLWDKEKPEFYTVGEFCDIGNGLVSGLDKAFQLSGHEPNDTEISAIIKVAKSKDLVPFFVENITQYIFIAENLEASEFQIKYPNFFQHLQPYKMELENRYQYNRKINYWDWVFLRNFNLFSKPERRIFVPCKERVSNKNYFRFALAEAGVFPTQDVTAIFKKQQTKESIEYILAYLNEPIIFDWLVCNGIRKGNIVEFSEKPIASIPFRKIDWYNPNEVLLHDSITEFIDQFLRNRDQNLLRSVHEQFCKLFEIRK